MGTILPDPEEDKPPPDRTTSSPGKPRPPEAARTTTIPSSSDTQWKVDPQSKPCRARDLRPFLVPTGLIRRTPLSGSRLPCLCLAHLNLRLPKGRRLA